MSGEAPQLHVVLVHPEIPWNAGNSGRTCLAAGARLHLVEPLGFSLEDRYLRRAGLDYWPQVQPRIWPSWDLFAAELPALGEPYFFSTEGELSYWQPRFPPRTVLVFGRESVGLPPRLRRANRRRLLSIPVEAGKVRSLNLSTAVALAVYEVRRQHAAGGAGSGAPPSPTDPG